MTVSPLSRAVMPERESSAIPWTLMSAINASIRSGSPVSSAVSIV